MKATLEFNLPEDDENFRLAIDGVHHYSALINIQQDVRAILKNDELDEGQYKIVERIYDLINEHIKQ